MCRLHKLTNNHKEVIVYDLLEKKETVLSSDHPLMLYSVEILPQKEIEKYPAGFGRSAPNMNPYLSFPSEGSEPVNIGGHSL